MTRGWRGWAGVVVATCVGGSLLAATAVQERADRFLNLVNAGYQALYRVESEAQWKSSTDVKPEHDAATETAGRARAAFNGNAAIIREARELLGQREALTELQVRQLQRCPLNAAEGPMTNPDPAGRRTPAQHPQASHRPAGRGQPARALHVLATDQALAQLLACMHGLLSAIMLNLRSWIVAQSGSSHSCKQAATAGRGPPARGCLPRV